jgi:hypothetical protein
MTELHKLIEVERAEKGVELSPRDDFFNRRLEGSKNSLYIVRIHSYYGRQRSPHSSPTRYVDFPEEIVSAMKLRVGNSVEWKCKGDLLVMTPLLESAISTKLVIKPHNFITALPVDMMSVSGLKHGDYVSQKIEDGYLRVRKAEGAGQDAVKISQSGRGETISILAAIAEELKLDAEKVKNGVWIVWKFDKKGLFGEFKYKNPHIETIINYDRKGAKNLCVGIPSGLGGWIENNDDVILQMKNGKLYMKEKEWLPAD